MEQVLFSNNGGLGIILNSNESESDFFKTEEIKIVDETLIPNSFYNLFGFFIEPIRFCGIFNIKNHRFLIFHSGNEDDLFDSKKYYYCIGYLSPIKLFNQYAPFTARDFNWNGNEWK
jgi:hypothetical protein